MAAGKGLLQCAGKGESIWGEAGEEELRCALKGQHGKDCVDWALLRVRARHGLFPSAKVREGLGADPEYFGTV